jgi:hypothetical protein
MVDITNPRVMMNIAILAGMKKRGEDTSNVYHNDDMTILYYLDYNKISTDNIHIGFTPIVPKDYTDEEMQLVKEDIRKRIYERFGLNLKSEEDQEW